MDKHTAVDPGLKLTGYIFEREVGGSVFAFEYRVLGHSGNSLLVVRTYDGLIRSVGSLSGESLIKDHALQVKRGDY